MASVGRDVALLWSLTGTAAMRLIALGMVGFLAATTQGPITSFIIVIVIVSGRAMVLSLMACALVASGVARMISRPMYAEFAALLPVPPVAARRHRHADGRNYRVRTAPAAQQPGSPPRATQRSTATARACCALGWP